MKRQNKMERLVRKGIYRNERKWRTRKAKRSQAYIGLTIGCILFLTFLIHSSQASVTVTYENPPFRWDTGKEAESSTAQPETQDEVEDGVMVQGDLEKRITEKFPEQAETAIALIKAESGLNPKKHSETDKMADGRAFSVGLMQINLTVHKLNGVDCTKAFSGRNYRASVINEELYRECVKLAEDPEISLATGQGIYQRSGENFGKWGAYTNGSFKKFL